MKRLVILGSLHKQILLDVVRRDWILGRMTFRGLGIAVLSLICVIALGPMDCRTLKSKLTGECDGSGDAAERWRWR